MRQLKDSKSSKGVVHGSNSLYPRNAACDFEEGRPHKGYSMRLRDRGVSDVITLLAGLNLDSSECDFATTIVSVDSCWFGPLGAGISSSSRSPVRWKRRCRMRDLRHTSHQGLCGKCDFRCSGETASALSAASVRTRLLSNSSGPL